MHGLIDKKKALTLIEGVISPYIGKTMAKASTDVHCEKLGIVADKITAKEVEALLDRLAKAMTVFVGKEKTEKLVDEMQATIRLEGGLK